MMKRNRPSRHGRHLPAQARAVLNNDYLNGDFKRVAATWRKYPRVYALPATMMGLLFEAGRVRRAERLWNRVIRTFPGLASPYFSRAHWALDQRDFAQAEKYLRHCLRRDTGYFRETAHFWRAEALFQLGRHQAALDALENVRDSYEEPWFLDYRSRSKQDLLSDIKKLQA